MKEHTKGPWKIRDKMHRAFSEIVSSGDTRIATVAPRRKCAANARLIAAAPELLDAAKDALPYMRLVTEEEDEGWVALDQLEIAIAKAESSS